MRDRNRAFPVVPNVVPWLAATVMLCNVLLLFPTVFWWLTNTILLPIPLLRQFDPNGECNLFTWYSSLLLALVSVTALGNLGLDSALRERAGWRRYAWLWLFLVTLFLSLDEAAGIHESADKMMRQRLEGGGVWSSWAGQFGKTWVITYSPGIVLVVITFFFIFLNLRSEPRGISRLAVAGLTLWMVAVGLEFVQTDLCPAVGETEMEPRCLQAEILVEESSEIFGTTSLLIAFLLYAQLRVRRLVRTNPVDGAVG